MDELPLGKIQETTVGGSCSQDWTISLILFGTVLWAEDPADSIVTWAYVLAVLAVTILCTEDDKSFLPKTLKHRKRQRRTSYTVL